MIRPGIRRLFRLPLRGQELAERETEEEIELHLALRAERLVRQGMAPAEARAEALRRFGPMSEARRELRRATRHRESRMKAREWLDQVLQDVRYGARQLRRSPGFAVVAILTLGLGIGGTTAVFTVVRAVLIEPLPYEQPGQLVRLYQYYVESPEENTYVSGPHFKEYRENASSFQDLASLYSYSETGADLLVGEQPERVRKLRISADYFRVLRQEPLEGRTFAREEEEGGPLAVVSERLALRLGDDARPGGSVELDGQVHTVVGVIPADFEDPIVGPVDVWVPEDLVSEGTGANEPQNHFLSVIGRLAPGVTAERAREEMSALNAALAEKYPQTADEPVRFVPLQEDLVAKARPTLLLLLGAVALVLLIACINVANLLMVHSMGRSQEMAVRSALGARGGRITRQLLVESVLLAAAGGLVGVGIAALGVDALLAVGDGAVPRAQEVRVDGMVLAFAATIALLTGIGFGLAPALRLAGTAPGATLREGGRGSAGGPRQGRVRSALVVGQVALALMLLLGAAALAASMYRLSQVDLGIRPSGVLTFELNLPGGRYDAEARTAFHRQMTERLSQLPGVSAVGATSRLPATGTYHSWGTRPLTGPLVGVEGNMALGEVRVVEGDYFGALGMPLVDGRLFDSRDGPESTPVALVTSTLVDELFPGTSPLGQRVRMGGQEREIVGVVGDVALDPEGEPGAYVYHLHSQFATNRNWSLTYVVATQGAAEALLPAIRREIAAVDPQLVAHRPAPLEEVLGRGQSQRRMAFILTSAFAALALTLAVLGLYGVLAYVVRQRTREIGIRIALGAEPGRVAWGVVRRGLAMTVLGIGLGILGALALGRVLASLVFRTEPTDPLIMAGAAAVLAAAALAAALVPAYRAMRVPPQVALRFD